MSSKTLARLVIGLLPCIKSCECTKIIKRMGIIIGLKEKPMQMHATRRTYLMNFKREKGVLIDNKMPFSMNEIWKFRSN